MQCAEKKKDDKADLEKGQVGVLVSLQMEWRCTAGIAMQLQSTLWEQQKRTEVYMLKKLQWRYFILLNSFF